MKKNLIFTIIVLYSIVFIFSIAFHDTLKSVKQLGVNAQAFMEYNETRKYALLIGGGTTRHDTCESYYKNIQYFTNTLEKFSDVRLGFCI